MGINLKNLALGLGLIIVLIGLFLAVFPFIIRLFSVSSFSLLFKSLVMLHEAKAIEAIVKNNIFKEFNFNSMVVNTIQKYIIPIKNIEKNCACFMIAVFIPRDLSFIL